MESGRDLCCDSKLIIYFDDSMVIMEERGFNIRRLLILGMSIELQNFRCNFKLIYVI